MCGHKVNTTSWLNTNYLSQNECNEHEILMCYDAKDTKLLQNTH